MKLLWINDVYADTSLFINSRVETVRALSRLGVEVEVSFLYRQEIPTYEGLGPVYYIALPRLTLANRLRACLQQVNLVRGRRDLDYVIVEPSSVHAFLPVVALSKRRSAPKYVLDVRTLPVDREGIRDIIATTRFWNALSVAAKCFSGITVITEPLRDMVSCRLRLPVDSIGVWTPGANVELFNPEVTEGYRESLGLTDRFVAMYHGILSPNRGLQSAVKAMDIVRKRHPEALLFILGTGPARELLQSLIAGMGLEKHVTLHPTVEHREVPKFIKDADIGILPFPPLKGWNVSNPLKLMEYLAMGKPAIVTDILAHRRIIADSPCGLYIPDNRPETIAEALCQAIEQKDQLPARGQAGAKIIKEGYLWEHQARKLKRYLEGLR
ncbi:MAG: glycosyltransferase [Pseudomonadota bacterium]